MRDLYYELIEDGYYIKDRNSSFKLHQYEPFIPYRIDENDKDYAKHAQAHIDEIKKEEAEAEKERVTIEKLQQELSLTQQELSLTKMAIDELMMLSMGGGVI